MIGAIVTAAGRGSRAGFGENKLLRPLGGGTVLEKTVAAFEESGLFGEILVTVSAEDETRVRAIFGGHPLVKIVPGGPTRTKSVLNGLRASAADIVLVHDGARPYVTRAILEDCIGSVKKYGSGVAAYPAADTLARAEDGRAAEVLGKDGLYVVQTPQGFYRRELLAAYEKARGDYPDESSVYAEFVSAPRLSLGSPANRKLTYREDFESFRTGNGYDTHRLETGRRLVLGGVEVPYEKGLAGHSDADVVVHALMDALLSGAGLRDIGCYFPDTDPKYKDADSVNLLREVVRIVGERGYKVENASVALLAERPKLAPYIDRMRENLANVLAVPFSDVGISVTTAEKLGFVGREEGMAAYATALLKKTF